MWEKVGKELEKVGKSRKRWEKGRKGKVSNAIGAI